MHDDVFIVGQSELLLRCEGWGPTVVILCVVIRESHWADDIMVPWQHYVLYGKWE